MEYYVLNNGTKVEGVFTIWHETAKIGQQIRDVFISRMGYYSSKIKALYAFASSLEEFELKFDYDWFIYFTGNDGCITWNRTTNNQFYFHGCIN